MTIDADVIDGSLAKNARMKARYPSGYYVDNGNVYLLEFVGHFIDLIRPLIIIQGEPTKIKYMYGSTNRLLSVRGIYGEGLEHSELLSTMEEIKTFLRPKDWPPTYINYKHMRPLCYQSAI